MGEKPEYQYDEKGNVIYTAEQKKEIRIHWAILFVMFYLTMSLSAMKALIDYNAIYGHVTCFVLSGVMSYFMSFMVYRWKTEKGWGIYAIVMFIILLMLARYQL
ncbi:MAG: hypothetical protein IIY33_03045 [Erysipelotrichaceae bacterium]|nr:hypothetical protein [Erysipelotrichaceae bacterium]